jgi:carboxyl-terminal processing protease
MRNVSSGEQRGSSLARSVAIGVGLGMLLALVFAAGFFAREWLPGAGRAFAASGEDYALLDEVQNLIDQHYVREQPDYTTRQYGAIRGMLQTLNDPFTFFIDPPVAASESQVLAGTYGGIGVQLVRAEDGSLLMYPFAASPAEAAGVQNGDVLLAINGSPLDAAMQMDAIDQALRGEVREGSGVTITAVRGDGTQYEVFIEFAVINVPSIVVRVLEDDTRLGYMQIIRFTNRTPDELSEAMQTLRDANVQALVVDLRNNTGGLLSESIEIADEFIDGGVLVYERDAEGETARNANAGGAITDLPLVLLVNNRTASGAELVAGAIQDLGRGILIGQTTYGKGTVQQIFGLSDGSSLHVTASEWFTPNQQPLEGAGLVPDVVIEADPEGRDVELAEAIRRLQDVLAAES